MVRYGAERARGATGSSQPLQCTGQGHWQLFGPSARPLFLVHLQVNFLELPTGSKDEELTVEGGSNIRDQVMPWASLAILLQSQEGPQ